MELDSKEKYRRIKKTLLELNADYAALSVTYCEVLKESSDTQEDDMLAETANAARLLRTTNRIDSILNELKFLAD